MCWVQKRNFLLQVRWQLLHSPPFLFGGNAPLRTRSTTGTSLLFPNHTKHGGLAHTQCGSKLFVGLPLVVRHCGDLQVHFISVIQTRPTTFAYPLWRGTISFNRRIISVFVCSFPNSTDRGGMWDLYRKVSQHWKLLRASVATCLLSSPLHQAAS